MSKMTEHFAAVRAAIERARAQKIAAHARELADFDDDLANITAAERHAEDIAGRYPVDKPMVLAKATKRHQSPSKKPRRAHGPHAPYSPADDERIMAAGGLRGNATARFGSLAVEMGRTVGGLERHHEELIKRPKQQHPAPPAGSPSPEQAAPEVAWATRADKVCERCAGRAEGCFDDGLCMVGGEPRAALDQPGSENTPIVEASQIEEVREPIEPTPWEPPPTAGFDHAAASSEIVRAARSQEETTLRRPPEAPYNWPSISEEQARVDPADIGRSLTGAKLDNGPKDRRVYDYPEAFTSKNSD